MRDVPFLPVGIFKRMFLASVPEKQIVRVLASSGTSGQTPSRIPLDIATRNRQMKALRRSSRTAWGGAAAVPGARRAARPIGG